MPHRSAPGFPARLAVFAALGVGLGLVGAPRPLLAKPAHKQALIDFFGPDLPKKLHDCRTCHLPGPADPATGEKPHNAFGARLKAVAGELRKAGKKTDIATRLQAVADEDSDGDGVSNFLELLSGHFPGDATDRPSASEIESAGHRLAAFRERLGRAYVWAPFETVRRPPVPVAGDPARARNPIDNFLAAEHQRLGLRPRPEAPRHVLLRRVYLDLVGLPPTRAELHAFLDDPAPDAYERVVERLLASPRYGERWGRHWMDVWRYSDWAGFGTEVRDSKPHVWHWRDWIVESLNADKGYDRMVLEMLAADELAPTDPDALRATGFLVRNWYLFSRNVWLERTVEHTGKAFLGVTLNCARCHDHFFDPISQKEYYAFRAVFETHDVRSDRLPGQPDLDRDALPRAYDGRPDSPTYLFVRGDEASPDKEHPVPPGVPAALGGSPYEIHPVPLPLEARVPDRRPFVVAETRARSQAALEQAPLATLAAQRVALAVAAQTFAVPPPALVARLPGVYRAALALPLADLDEELALARHLELTSLLDVEQQEDDGHKGAPAWQQAARLANAAQRRLHLLEARRQEQAARLERWFGTRASAADATRSLAEAEARRDRAEAEARQPASTAFTPRTLARYPDASSGRRLALARWIADRKNPLTARVAVNHLWLRHFGTGLVPTEFDFGRNGRPPTHPALLDWLAAEFMDRGWGMKALHRLLVTSAAYRMDSRADAHDLALDPDNRFLWRQNVRRMEGEVVRDSLLWVAGRLDSTLGGPDLDHHLGLTVPRRSLYFQHAAEKQMEFLTLFDPASVNECYRRSESVIPQQALALANSPLALAQARLLARELSDEAGQADAAFLRAGFEQVLGRPPSAEELSVCARFLAAQSATLSPPRARENLVHVLLNHNDFVTIR